MTALSLANVVAVFFLVVAMGEVKTRPAYTCPARGSKTSGRALPRVSWSR
jgi:hypothetical protein